MSGQIGWIILSTFACAGNLLAHAVLLEASPPPRGSVSGPGLEFRLRFNSRIDAPRSILTLVFPDGTQHKIPIGPRPSPDVISGKADNVKSGQYRLRWQVLAADGHITRGEVPFEVR